MLYPEFQELIKLQSKAKALSKFNNYMSDSLDAGNKTSIFRGHGMEFEEVRPYVFGDDVRYIDWRVTARSQQVAADLLGGLASRVLALVNGLGGRVQAPHLHQRERPHDQGTDQHAGKGQAQTRFDRHALGHRNGNFLGFGDGRR